MKLTEIAEKYQQIKMSNHECIKLQEAQEYAFKEEIRESFKSLEIKEVSEKFSEYFQIWCAFGDEDLRVNTLKHDPDELIAKYQEYMDFFSLLPPKNDHSHRLVASRGFDEFDVFDGESVELKLNKLLDFADDKTIKSVIASKEIIEYMLEILWDCLFQNNLSSIDNAEAYLNKKQDVDCSEFKNSYHKDWALYELINQMKRYMVTLIKNGEVKRKKFSQLKESEQIDIVLNSSDLCEHILNKYITKDATISSEIRSWGIPDIHRGKDLLLSNIIMTSDLVGYMFEYKLKTTIQKNKLKEDALDLVTHLYRGFISGKVVYDAMFNYAEVMEEEYIVTYNNKPFYPKVVFNFLLSIIQEVIRRTLTKRKDNIFNQLSGNNRDDGLSEQKILSKVKKDSKTYFLMYAYFDNPVKKTFNKKRVELESWIESLNTLRFGVLDEYLFELSQATQISYKAKTVTEFVTIKPKS